MINSLKHYLIQLEVVVADYYPGTDDLSKEVPGPPGIVTPKLDEAWLTTDNCPRAQ